MSATITDGTTTITPSLVLGYDASQSSGNILHKILDRPDVDVSLSVAGLRTGTLQLLFDTAADAEAARALHVQATQFVYADDDEVGASMTYVVDPGGTIDISIDTDTFRKYTLAVPFQEVA